MTKFVKALATAGAASIFAMAAPAAAQVEGKIGTVNAPGVVIGTTAFQTAYEKIPTTYKPQIDTRNARVTRRQEILAEIDTNDDNEVDDAELAAVEGTPIATELTTVEQQISQIQNQLDAARIYAIEQIVAQYPTALDEVTTAQGVGIVLSPEVVVFGGQDADLSEALIASLNTKVSDVGVVPPQGWQPRRDVVQLYQQIQQILRTVQNIQAQQAAAAAQQQGAQTQPTEAPVGR